MSLAPESRVTLTDALRPPAGFHVDIAVGTTYTLDLTALLMAPLSFAVAGSAAGDEHIDPIRLLEAVRRHADRTTVFVQAGGIAVPANYRSILTFIEDSICEVAPPPHAGIFHPKIWALRFMDDHSTHLHRLVVLSRNLTFDRSWDIALVLDEAPDGTIDAAPAASFVRSLPALGLHPLTERQRTIDDLCDSLERVRFAAPAPFTGGRLVPIGMTAEAVWPFPGSAERMLAISPFLTAGAVETMAKISPERTVVSRAESFDLIGARTLDGWQTRTLRRLTEGGAAEVTPEADTLSPHDGLHAKTFVLDLPTGESMTVTGSANMTSFPWGRGVEFDAVLTGPTDECGVERVLGDDGLAPLLSGYDPAQAPVLDPTMRTTTLIEQFHRSVAAAHPVLHVDVTADDRVTLTLEIDAVASPGETRVWPASLSATHARPLADAPWWTIAAKSTTPFLVVETTAGHGDARATARCVIVAALAGDVGDRRADALRDVLSSKADVLRYLVFLLEDPSYDVLLSAASATVTGHGDFDAAASAQLALFEPLVRALGRNTDVLARVASLVDELRALPDGDDLIPEAFDDLWDVVWHVHQEVGA